jgi:hypothetical protein
MHTFRFSSLLLGSSLCLGLLGTGLPVAHAQTHAEQQMLPLPQVSPHAVVAQTVGLTDITVDYHSPSVRGRAIWGQLVPYEQVWRAGANENTVISFADPVILNGKSVPAGRYSFYVVPHETQDWEIILNRVITHWGAEGYDAKDDQLRLTAAPETAAMHENLLFWFSELKPASARLNLTWEKRTVGLLVETDVHTKVLATIQQTIAAQPRNWQLLAQAADYLVQNNLESELALRYINESIRLKEAYTNTWIKARLLASQQDYGTAIEVGRKAIKLGERQDTNFKTQLPGMRLALTEWQSKAY